MRETNKVDKPKQILRFEKNLDSAQVELGIESAQAVPVLYKTRMEMSDLFSFIPTLLIMGFLFWSMRRAGSMMGGRRLMA